MARPPKPPNPDDVAPIINKGNSDEETMSAIYRGLNQSQLMALFRVDNRVVKKAIFESGAKPVGRVNKGDIYSVYEVAPYLVKPVGDIEAYIRRMDHNDLPKQLTKEFWTALRQRQEYQKAAGQLWPTEKVIAEVGELFKVFKMGALLFTDTLDRQTTLSEKQKGLIREMVRGLLNDVQSRIVTHFQPPEKDEPNVKPQEAADDDI